MELNGMTQPGHFSKHAENYYVWKLAPAVPYSNSLPTSMSALQIPGSAIAGIHVFKEESPSMMTSKILDYLKKETN